MNKNGLIILIVFLALVIVTMTGGFIYLLSSNFSWGEINFVERKSKLIDTQTYESLDSITLDTKAIDIVIQESNTEEIITEVYSNKNIDYSSSIEDNKLTLKAHQKNSVTLFSFGFSSKVIVKLPSNYAGELNIDAKVGDISIKTFNDLNATIVNSVGDLSIDELKNVNIEITTGDIYVKEAKEINIKLNTGDIDINEVSVLKIDSKTGDISIKNIDDSFSIKANTGDIDIKRADLKANSKIDHRTGDINIKKLTNAYIEVSSKVGDTKVNNNDRYAELTCTIKNNVGDIRVN